MYSLIYYFYQLIDIILYTIFGSDIFFDKIQNKLIINNIEYIKIIHNFGIKYDVNTIDSKGKTIFMKIFDKNTNWNNLRNNIMWLKSKGADINFQDNDGYTPLMYASVVCSSCEKNKLIKFMIEQKANVNLKNKNGDTVILIILTTWNNRLSLLTSLQYLLYLGNANINVKNNLGITPLMQIAKISGILSKSFVLDYVINHDANINMTDNDGNTALMHVLQNIDTTSSIYAAKILIDAGSDLSIKNNMNKTAKDYITDDLQYLLSRNLDNNLDNNLNILNNIDNSDNESEDDYQHFDPVIGLKYYVAFELAHMLYKKIISSMENHKNMQHQ